MLAAHLMSWACSVPRVLSVPYGSSIISREATSKSAIAAIDAKILDHGSHDITSSIKIMLLYDQLIHTKSNNLSDRQVTLSRPLNACSIGTFYESFCIPENNNAGSLQSYRIVCHDLVPVSMPAEGTTAKTLPGFIPYQAVRFHPRDGHCTDNEICVPGLGAQRSRSGRKMASCVSTQLFVEYISRGNTDQQGLDLEGMGASMVFSQLDGKTPVEVSAFEIDAQTNTGRLERKKSCRDCTELSSDHFGSEAETLKIEATLLSTGAIAGVLWLAIVSG